MPSNLFNLALALACIASVSVGLGSKERPRNGTGTVFCPREIIVGARAKVRKRVGEGKEGNACGQPPGFWKTPFASDLGSWVAGPAKDWHVSIIGSRRATVACLQKFLAEQGFSRELRQHGGNPVVPTLWDFEARQCDTIFVIFLLRCLKPRLPKFQRLSFVCLVTGDNTRNDFFPLACLANAFLLELAL